MAMNEPKMSTEQWLKRWQRTDGTVSPRSYQHLREEARLRRVAKRKGWYLLSLRGEAASDAGGQYALIRKGGGMDLDKVREILEGRA
jgi:hypothetical protein